MRRWILVAALVLAPTSSWAIWVECPDGNGWAGSVDQIHTCPCCVFCEDGTWYVEGEGDCEEQPASTDEAAEETFDFGLGPMSMEDTGTLVMLNVFGLVAFCAYFLPAIIAARRRHHQRNAIILVNLMLGWTVLGWIIALVWAATAVKGEG